MGEESFPTPDIKICLDIQNFQILAGISPSPNLDTHEIFQKYAKQIASLFIGVQFVPFIPSFFKLFTLNLEVLKITPQDNSSVLFVEILS